MKDMVSTIAEDTHVLTAINSVSEELPECGFEKHRSAIDRCA
jgi:hypothetical protein